MKETKTVLETRDIPLFTTAFRINIGHLGPSGQPVCQKRVKRLENRPMGLSSHFLRATSNQFENGQRQCLPYSILYVILFLNPKIEEL